MSKTVAFPLVLLLCFSLSSIALGAEDIARNGNCEQMENGKPVGWGAYCQIGEWGSLEAGYEGKGAYFIPGDYVVEQKGSRKGERSMNCAIVLGSANGTSGPEAYTSEPSAEASYSRRPSGAAYRISFWAKSESSQVDARVQCWRTDEATGADRSARAQVARIPRIGEWTHYEKTVALPGDTKKFAVMFQIWGFENDGLELGKVCVDEVTIEPAAQVGLTADDLPRISIPKEPAVYDGNTPIEEIIEAYRAGDKGAIAKVQGTLDSADGMAAKSDEWYRQFFKSFEPSAVHTITCPIHPFKTREYNPFLWSLDEPWKLICRHCKAEGRKYHYYPNPDYPDDGDGCRPTDEIWRRDHDEAWSKAHRGIAWDHWDGQTHGEIGGSRAFYFMSHYYNYALLRLNGTYCPQLGLAYHYATKLFPPGSEQYEKGLLYGHKAQVIILTTARAHMGDDYLATAEGMTPEQFQPRMEDFYRPSETDKWHYEKLTGFRPFRTSDARVDDPHWADVVEQSPYGYSLFQGAWNRKAGYCGSLLEGFCRASASFSEGDDDLRRIAGRVLVSLPGDRDKVAKLDHPVDRYLKRGIFEMTMQPYSLKTGGDNLAPATQRPCLRAGLLLRDDKMVENVARDISYFWRNYFSEDGLGHEGSPSYSAYGITSIMDALYGLKGDFNKDAPYFDKELGGLNLAKLPEYQACAVKMPYYVTEDDIYIPWEDCLYDRKRDTSQLTRIEKYGDGIPEKHRKYFLVNKDDQGNVTVSFNGSVVLPPVLLHDRRKAILRSGGPLEPTVVSLDFTKRCGHYHPPPQTLIVHACGQELASDLGYLGAEHFLTRAWIRAYPAHNCLTLRKADGNPHGTEKLRGDLRSHFITTPFCQVVDSAEYDAADWKVAGEEEVGEFSRQVFLMTPSEDHQYVIDIARGKGGATHDYYLHCHGLGFGTEGIKLQQAADAEQDLYDYSGWSFNCAAGYGAKNVHELAAGTSEGTWRATWSQIDDYRGQPDGKPLIHEDVFLRLWMPGDTGSEVIAGTAPAQRDYHNQDIDRTMKVICVRRPNTEEVDNFLAVIEPYKHTPFIKDVRRLQVQGGDEYHVAVAVETLHGTDYLIAYGGPGEPSQVTLRDGKHVIRSDADIAVVSYPNSGGARMLVAGGQLLSADGSALKLEGPTRYTGRLLDFNDADDTLLIEGAEAWPEGDTLAGRPVIVQHTEDRSTFLIKSVSAQGKGRYLVQLDDQPHLMNNWLLVKKVDAEGIVIEPPAVLDGKNTYKVYGGEPGRMRMLGPLRGFGSKTVYNEYGTRMHTFQSVLTDSYEGVEPGQEIGITRLEKGVDTVSVTNFAYATTDM